MGNIEVSEDQHPIDALYDFCTFKLKDRSKGDKYTAIVEATKLLRSERHPEVFRELCEEGYVLPNMMLDCSPKPLLGFAPSEVLAVVELTQYKIKHTLKFRRAEGIFGNHTEVCPPMNIQIAGGRPINVDNCTLQAATKFCDRLIFDAASCVEMVIGNLQTHAKNYDTQRWDTPTAKDHYKVLGITRDVNTTTVNAKAEELIEFYNSTTDLQPLTNRSRDRIARVNSSRNALVGGDRAFTDQPCQMVLPGMCARKKADGSMIIEM
jgi:hypothetical protein